MDIYRKRYLIEDNCDIPSTTAWRWRRNREQQAPLAHSSEENIEHAQIPEVAEMYIEDHTDECDENSIDSESDSGNIDSDIISDCELEDEHVDLDNSAEVDPSENIWEGLKKPLSNHIKTTVAEAFLLLMNFILRFNMPWTAMEELCQLMNIIFGHCALPTSKYTFSKLLGGMNSTMSFHMYCPACQHYLGKKDTSTRKENYVCSVCNKQSKTQKLMSEGYFFATIPIASQMEELLQNKELATALEKQLAILDSAQFEPCVKDITSGELYRKQRISLRCRKDDVTITINTDGSPVFKSSKSAIWPVQFVINELPPHLRWKNVIVSGLWFGKTHPNMRLFLKAHVDDILPLEQKGIQWRASDRNIHQSRVFAICCCVDSPARAVVQNSTQYNGYFGCTWCLHPGVNVDGGSQIRYVVQNEPARDRSAKSVLQDMELALHQGHSVRGIKGPSPLMNLPGFDIVWGFTTEYMHSLLLGVVRQITELWLTSVDEMYYIGAPRILDKIDSRLLKIKTPHIITRLPRSIMTRKYWKATEWRNWLLYYSIPCLSGILERKILKHWILLAHGSYLALQDVISFDDINLIDMFLSEFVIRTEILYGKLAMTSNVHQLLHYAKSIKLLGPLWSRSAFVFESKNGELLKLVTAAKGAPMQVLNRYLFKMKVRKLINDDKLVSAGIFNSLQRLNSHGHILDSLEIQQNHLRIYMLGKNRGNLSRKELDIFFSVTKCPNFDSLQVYNRMLVSDSLSNSIYHSELYIRSKKTNNTVICAKNQKKYVIKKCIVYNNASYETKCGALCQELVLVDDGTVNLPGYMKKCYVPPADQLLTFIWPDEISRICVFIDGEEKYVCNIPNVVERD